MSLIIDYSTCLKNNWILLYIICNYCHEVQDDKNLNHIIRDFLKSVILFQLWKCLHISCVSIFGKHIIWSRTSVTTQMTRTDLRDGWHCMNRKKNYREYIYIFWNFLMDMIRVNRSNIYASYVTVFYDMRHTRVRIIFTDGGRLLRSRCMTGSIYVNEYRQGFCLFDTMI